MEVYYKKKVLTQMNGLKKLGHKVVEYKEYKSVIGFIAVTAI